MHKIIAAVFLAVFSFSLAFAQAPASTDCESKAIDKNGKPLAGAAKSAFMKKCAGATNAGSAGSDCEAKAIDKNGKPLAGAAKSASIKKCEGESKPKK